MSSYNKIVQMAIPFADILEDGDFPIRYVGVYKHFNNIVFSMLQGSVYALKGLRLTQNS
jgi:hypothetical protein